MGSVFALQVRTGFEIKAKEMLKHVIRQTNETLVKGIYALETHTEIINKDTDLKSVEEINREDDLFHLRKQELRTSITNRRRQLDSIERYNTTEYNDLKEKYKDEINQLERQFNQIGRSSKKVHSVMSGYILLELIPKSKYLPNHLWHLIKSVPLVSNILSTSPIPDEEMEFFAERLEETLEPKAEIEFGEKLDHSEIDVIESEILTRINEENTKKETQDDLINKIDKKTVSIVEKVRDIIKSKKKTSLTNNIKTFVRRSKQIVVIPLRYLKEMYTNKEIQFVGDQICSKDFLSRLKRLLNQLGQEVIKC